jgi:hypothetical protein
MEGVPHYLACIHLSIIWIAQEAAQLTPKAKVTLESSDTSRKVTHL